MSSIEPGVRDGCADERNFGSLFNVGNVLLNTLPQNTSSFVLQCFVLGLGSARGRVRVRVRVRIRVRVRVRVSAPICSCPRLQKVPKPTTVRSLSG